MNSQVELDPSAGNLRELLRVAVPLVMSSGSIALMVFVDRMYLTWYSTDALAAALPAALLHWSILSLPLGIGMYVNSFVAQYEGAGRKDRVAAAIWQGVYLSLLAGVVILFIVPFARPMFSLIGHAAEVQKLEVEYFSVLASGAGVMVMAAVLSCFYSGRGQTMIVLYVNLGIVTVNIILDYCLIFGYGPFPAWGIRGAAVVTVFANVLGVLAYGTLILTRSDSREYHVWANRLFDRELFARLMRYGFPSGLQFTVDVTAFMLFVLMVGSLGKDQLAATNLAFNLNALAFIPMMGFGIAVMTLVGKRIGEGRPEVAVRTTWNAFALAGGYMSVFALLIVLVPDVVMYPFALFSEPAEFAPLREQAYFLLKFIAVFAVFDAMAIIFSSAVRGAGDTRFSLIFTFLTSWLLMVMPTFIAWWMVGGNLFVSWAACTTYVAVLGVGFMIRFHMGKWKSMRIIESDKEWSPQSPHLTVDGDVEVALETS